MTDEHLQEYFKFDDADLRTNRSGSLTPKQVKRLRSQDQFNKGCLSFAGFLALGGVVLVVTWNAFSWWEIPLWVLAALGLAVVVSLLPRPAYQVATAEGPLKTDTVEYRSGTNNMLRHDYALYVGDQKFAIDKPTKNTLAQYATAGDRYAVYYLAKTREIVSLEWVAKSA